MVIFRSPISGYQWRSINFASSIRTLGGYSAPMQILRPLLLQATDQPLRILDLGRGSPIFPEYLVRWVARLRPDRTLADRCGRCQSGTVGTPAQAPPGGCPPICSPPSRVDVADALACLPPSSPFDVVNASMFLHQLRRMPRRLQVMESMGRLGAPRKIPGSTIRSATPWPTPASMGSRALLQASEMIKKKKKAGPPPGPISVLRVSSQGKLQAIAHRSRARARFDSNGAGLFSLATEHHPLEPAP